MDGQSQRLEKSRERSNCENARLKVKEERPKLKMIKQISIYRVQKSSRKNKPDKVSFPLSSFLFPLMAVVLSGCMVGPDYEKPEVDTPAAWRYEVSEAADTVNTAWWRQFDDPVLDELVDEALQNNKDVRIAVARVEEFSARVDITRSGLFPQVGYTGGAERNQTSLETVGSLPPGISRTNDLYNAALNVGWELDIWGKIRRATEAARAELLASEESKRTVILSLVSAVASSYISLRTLDKQLVIATDTLATRKDT